jgi:hypothetical protein
MPRRKWPKLPHQPGRPRTRRLSWRKVEYVYGKQAERLGCPDGTLCDLTPAPGRTYIRGTFPPSGRGRGESLTSPRRIEAKLRAAKVLQLRSAGLTFQQIGRQVGLSTSGAYRAMQRTIDRIDWDRDQKERSKQWARA